MRIVERKYNPPDPNARCRCGLDTSLDGLRYSIVCPKHDGEHYEIVTDADKEAEAGAEMDEPR